MTNNNIQPPRAKKKYSQNFLHDKNIINKIINAFGPKETDDILEIGPGVGALTGLLLKKASKLTLVEIDKDLAEKLSDTYKDQVKLYNEDILKFDFSKIIQNLNNKYTNNKIRIIGNLPYKISTPILFYLFNSLNNIQDMLFMLQLEVVDRITAKPNTKEYGRLSIMTQFYCDCEKLFTIAPTAFIPRPKVQSAIVYLKPKEIDHSKLVDINKFQDVVAAAFNQRRKTISNSLKKFITADDLTKLNINNKARAENLTIEQYIKITNNR